MVGLLVTVVSFPTAVAVTKDCTLVLAWSISVAVLVAAAVTLDISDLPAVGMILFAAKPEDHDAFVNQGWVVYVECAGGCGPFNAICWNGNTSMDKGDTLGGSDTTRGGLITTGVSFWVKPRIWNPTVGHVFDI